MRYIRRCLFVQSFQKVPYIILYVRVIHSLPDVKAVAALAFINVSKTFPNDTFKIIMIAEMSNVHIYSS